MMNKSGVEVIDLEKGEVIDVDSYSSTKKEMASVGADSNKNSAVSRSNKRDISMINGGGNYDGKVVIPSPEAKQSNLKLLRTIKKGSAPLDQCLPDHIKNSYHVYGMGDDSYDAILTLTNVEEDSNEIYVFQVLEANSGDSYVVYNRWGRVGENGQFRFSGPHVSCDIALREFEETFYEKTKNRWCERKEYIPYPKCYTWLEVDYSKQDQGQPSTTRTVIQPRSIYLEPRVAKFISLIFNINMMTQQMKDIGYNVEKLPLKNLSKSTILKGYDVLKVIDEVLDIMGQANTKLLEELSGEFYSIIPHDFGSKKLCEFVIDTPKKLRSKLEMVEALGEIEHATRLAAGVGIHEDPLFAQFETLHCRMVPIEPKSKEFSMIESYMKDTCSRKHSQHTADVVHIFAVSREGENERFEKYAKMKNRMLLWHGSRLTNWIGILSQGLRIAPDQVPHSGASYGKGIYFSDMFAKSSAYCRSTPDAADAILLLCEVALGDMHEVSCANRTASKLPPGKLSLKAAGKTAPSKSMKIKDGVVVPLGPVETSQTSTGHCNEYVVYNVDQVKMHYIVQVKLNWGQPLKT